MRKRLPWRGTTLAGATDSPLVRASLVEFLTPLSEFGPAEHVQDRVFLTAQGVYLLTASHLGEGVPVVAVGWARNDHDAVQVWATNSHSFRNDRPSGAEGVPAPPMKGWPHPLSYAETLARAKSRAREPVMVSARYRFPTGAFQSHVVQAAPRVAFHYGAANPGPEDVAIAVELGLGGRRWEQHLAQVRAENEAP